MEQRKHFKFQGLAVTCLAFLSIGMLCHGQAPSPEDQDRESAIALERAGNLSEAEQHWRDFLDIHKSSAEANAHIGFLEARQEHFDNAVHAYEEALRLDPEFAGLRLNLGLACFKSGKLDCAIRQFSRAREDRRLSAADLGRVTTLLGMSYYGHGDYSAAIPLLKQAIADQPDSLWLRLTLAQSCLGAKQYPCVLDVYHEILKLNPDSAEADLLAGEALDEMKDHPGAIQQFRAAVKADPKLPNAHFGLGYVLWTQNQFEAAQEEFEAELTNVPDHPQALTYLGDVYIKLGREDAARPLLEKALKLDPQIALAHLDLGVVFAQEKRKGEALREMRAAERLDPANQTVHWLLAKFLKAVGQQEEAKVEFEKTRRAEKEAESSLFEKLHRPQDEATTSTSKQTSQP